MNVPKLTTMEKLMEDWIATQPGAHHGPPCCEARDEAMNDGDPCEAPATRRLVSADAGGRLTLSYCCAAHVAEARACIEYAGDRIFYDAII